MHVGRRARPRGARAAVPRRAARGAGQHPRSSPAPMPRRASRNILKMKARGLEVGPILMGMGNRAHIVTPVDHRARPPQHERHRRHAGRRTTAEAPVVVGFVLGSPRSGTTWLGAVLGSTGWARGLGEYGRFWRPGSTARCTTCLADGLDDCTHLHGIEAVPEERAFAFAAARLADPARWSRPPGGWRPSRPGVASDGPLSRAQPARSPPSSRWSRSVRPATGPVTSAASRPSRAARRRVSVSAALGPAARCQEQDGAMTRPGLAADLVALALASPYGRDLAARLGTDWAPRLAA